MTTQHHIAASDAPHPSKAKTNGACLSENIIVIGAGPAAIRFSQELLKKTPNAKITLFGNEPSQPYNRVQLSALLAGEISYDDILTDLPNADLHSGFSLHICAISSINTEQQQVIDALGNTHHYDKLVIATGSRPHVPNIPGTSLTGVYTFRNLKDTEFLYARISRARHIVVVGGGLLGLEAARALLRSNTCVTLIQQGPRLMNRQLDDVGASLLQKKIEGLGVTVIKESGVRQIIGDARVEKVITRSKDEIECDTVLLCAGIKANVEIARKAKITVSKGIVVNDRLQTSVDNVFAIGECCEHRGLTYGLVNPGFEQAAVLADIFNQGSSHYIGSLEVSRLKVVGESVCSMGEVADVPKRPFLREFKFQKKSDNIYRKLVVHKGKIIGAMAYGEWDESRRVQEAYQQSRTIYPWHIVSFYITGRLFGSGSGNHVSSWPPNAIVCQCNNLSQGELTEAVSSGNDTMAQLQMCTGAGTVCGSCKPLLSDLIGDSSPAEKEKMWASLLSASLIAILIALLIVFLPALSVSDSVQSTGILEKIWNDKFWKQVTGFSLLGMSSIGLLMSLRKKIANKRLGDFAYWRLLHIVLGVLCASTLILHTGLHFGANFNQILMIDFIAILILGSLAGAVMALSHKFDASLSAKIRRFWTWAHIFVTWPLPILLGFHILSVYYF